MTTRTCWPIATNRRLVTELPPRTIIDTASGFRIIGNDMLPIASSRRDIGNGDDEGSSE